LLSHAGAIVRVADRGVVAYAPAAAVTYGCSDVPAALPRMSGSCCRPLLFGGFEPARGPGVRLPPP